MDSNVGQIKIVEIAKTNEHVRAPSLRRIESYPRNLFVSKLFPDEALLDATVARTSLV